MNDIFSKVNKKIDNMVDDIFDSNGETEKENVKHEDNSSEETTDEFAEAIGELAGAWVEYNSIDEHADVAGVLLWVFGLLTVGMSGLFIFIDSLAGDIDLFPTTTLIIAFSIGIALTAIASVRHMKRKRQTKELNKTASLVVTSGLRRIDDIVRLSGMTEVKVIDNLRILTAASSSLKLGNDAHYLKGGRLDLQTMEIKLSDKYIEKEPWTCVYCRSVNEKDALVCTSCHAPKKKV